MQISLVVGLILAGLFASSSLALAETTAPVNNIDKVKCATGFCEDIKKQSGGKSTLDKNPIILILTRVIQILSGLVAVLAVIGLIAAGLQYASSADDAGKVKAAKERITQIIIGLILYLFMVALLNFLVPGGVFR